MNRTARTAFIAILLGLTAAGTPPASAGSGGGEPLTPDLRSGFFSYRFVSDTDEADALFINPAGLGARADMTYIMSGTYCYDRLAEITGCVSLPVLGLGYSRQERPGYISNSYVAGIGPRFGGGLSIGTSLRWNHTDIAVEGSPFSVDLGFLIRPARFLSIGGVLTDANRPRFGGMRMQERFTGGISVRPYAEWITLSAQGTFTTNEKSRWMFGGRLSPIPGLELFVAYRRDLSIALEDPYEEFSAGIAVGLGTGRIRTSTRARVNGDYEYSRNSFAIEGSGAFTGNTLILTPKYAEVRVGGNYLDEGGGFTLIGGDRDLHGVLRDLKSVTEDRDIKGLLLCIGPMDGAFIGPVSANLYEIREAVLEIRESGKPVVAYLEQGGGAAEIYLASAADRIVVPGDCGGIGMIGVSLEIKRKKRLFGKLGVDWDHISTGDYKSSFHTQYTDTTTDAQREEIASLVEESYRLLVEGIAEGRGLEKSRILQMADGRIFMPDEAVEHRIADVIGWKRKAREELGLLAGSANPERLSTVSISGRRYRADRWAPPPSIAVVGAYGTINPGNSKREFFRGGRTMGSASVVKQLEAASRYPGVRAIVLRVDSGGGSGIASAEILNEVRRIQRETGKQVIISMGNIAGSGGYWISMYGDEIFADPFTITGSIGVVFAKPVLERLYEKAGITNEVFKVGEHSDAYSAARMLTVEERGMFGRLIDRFYHRFIEQVAEGRNMDPEDVRALAGGRVYLGTQALDNGLIDRLGGLTDAVSFAASEAGIADDYRVVYFRAFPGFLGKLGIGNLRAAAGAFGLPWPGGNGCFDEVLTVH